LLFIGVVELLINNLLAASFLFLLTLGTQILFEVDLCEPFEQILDFAFTSALLFPVPVLLVLFLTLPFMGSQIPLGLL